MWGNLLSCIKGVQTHFDFQVGTQGCSRGTAGKGPRLSLRRNLMVFHELRVAAGSLEFLSSCKRGVRHPVKLRWGTWAFSRGATVESDLASRCGGNLVVAFKSMQGNQALS